MNIGIFTSTRAEFGLLRPLMRRFEKDKEMNMTVFVSGTHLSYEHGYTFSQIEEEGFENIIRIPVPLGDVDPTGMCVSLGESIKVFAHEVVDKDIDAMVILGDRFEAFGMAVVCHMNNVPIIHIHGGEVTEGAVDDAFRHSITKMSSLHFSSCEEHRKRIVQLGEEEWRVFDVGALGIENIIKEDKMSLNELQEFLGVSLGDEFCIITCHPETAGEWNVGNVYKILHVLDEFPQLKVIFTGSNMDAGGKAINEILKEVAYNNPGRYIYVDSLGLKRYISAVSLCRFVLGNSSSGVIEVPALRKPAINIGDRQGGRKRTFGIVDVPWDEREIRKCIQRVLSGEFDDSKSWENVFGDGDTSEKIVKIIRKWNLEEKFDIKKKFEDMR